jgi:hypothetical protein
MEIRLVEAELFHVGRRTDMTKIIIAFRIFTNEVKHFFLYVLRESFRVRRSNVSILSFDTRWTGVISFKGRPL